MLRCPCVSPDLGSSVAFGFLYCLDQICTLCQNSTIWFQSSLIFNNAFMWLPLAFQVGLNYFQMIILLKDRDFLSSLEVIDILMVILCIWPFEGATVNIGYCIGYCKIFETGLLALCLYECLSGKGATNWSKLLLVEYWPSYA